MRRVELLSPAKNVDVAIAAINNGADAVYIGGPAFGARKAVGNSLEDIEKAVRYAHRFYCRVFVTLNTILYDEELPEVERLIHDLYRIGVDAIIVQDPAIITTWSESSFWIDWDSSVSCWRGSCRWSSCGRFAGR